MGRTSPAPDTGPRRRAAAALLALAAVAFTALLWLAGWLPAVDRVSGDILLRAAGTPSASRAPVCAVLIDDRAVARHGPLPWPRERLARVVAAIADSGAAAIAVDLLLVEPADEAGDAALAAAFEARPATLAAAFDREGGWLLPLPDFGGTAAAAHVYGEVGPDGVVRTVASTKQADGLALPALSLAAARLLRPRLAILPGSVVRPAFQPPPQELPSFSAAAALEGGLPAAGIGGRLVFLGVSATGAGDQFVVPTGPRRAPVPGVLAHASAAASILDGRLLGTPPLPWSAAAGWLLAFGVQLLRDRRGAFDLAAFSALLAGVAVISLAAARWGLLLLPVAAFVVAMVASALLRETAESRLAHRETGRLLQSVLAHVGEAPLPGAPRTARARLLALRRLQQRVLEEDAARRALLAGMAEGVVMWGPDGALVEANPAARRLWGGVPDAADLAAGNGSPGDEWTVQRGPRELSVQTADLDSGRLAIIRDVTAERALERRRQEMQRLVSHELKTPLASIAGFGETLERYRLSGDELSRVASLIRGEAQRLQEMVTVFLDLERLGAGHWDEAAEIQDLGALTGARLEVLGAAAAARGVGIAHRLAPGCRVRGVAALLERVVDNLVGNAVTYTDRGDTVEVDLRREGDELRLSVRDHGPGIPEASRGRIFERFYRAPGSGAAGSGLGLALVKEVVTWHGGCITVDSEIGRGSCFTATLPAAPEA
jgi:signal transduction histidine kinase